MADDPRPLRLCLVAAEYSTVTRGGVGGIGAHFYTLAHALAEAGHQVVVLTEAPDRPQQSTEGGIEVRAIAPGSPRQWKLGRWLPVRWLKWSSAVRRGVRQAHAERALDLVAFPDGYGEGFRFSLSPFIPFVVMLLGPASIVQR
ncbi:MAG TPA: glycosyltransferase family 4 protein, partial [Casimicrobiaceae bacterium]|nr:glycosyltransferase family 4 protein [Casimicrobiaceae bacterium]